MANNRCFLCGHKMLESGLCSNSDCVRSKAVGENENGENNGAVQNGETQEIQAESGSDA